MIWPDQGLHREVFQDALLDLVQAVVIFFQDALGLFDVELVLGVLVPRQRQEPVEVVAHHGRLGRHRRHHLELLDLALALLARLGRHLLLAQLVFQLLDLVLELVLLAEFFLDRAHLLVEVVLFLGLLHLLLDPSTDALFDFEDLQLRAHIAEDLLQPLGRIGGLQQRLLLFELDPQMPDQLVGQIGRIVDRRDRRDHLGRDLLVEPDVVVEGRDNRAHQRFDLGRALADLGHFLDFNLEEFAVRNVAHDAGALLAFQQGLDGSVGQAQQLHHHAQRAHRVNIVGRGLGNLGVFLGREQDRFLQALGLFQRLYRLMPPHEDRIDFMRKNNEFTQRQQRNDLRRRLSRLSFLSLRKSILFIESPRTQAVSAAFLVDQQRRFLLTYYLL